MQEAEAFFEWLDLDHDGLADVKACVEKHNYPKAGEALLAYYRSRNHVKYYDGWEQPTGQDKFNTTKADEICLNHLLHQDLPEDIDWRTDPHGDPDT